ncbi:MAG: hypothetical protein OXD40_15430 [bacterium]|nr:hypothetical protein [bacterium]
MPTFDLSGWEPYAIGIGGAVALLLLYRIDSALNAILVRLYRIERELKGLPPERMD